MILFCWISVSNPMKYAWLEAWIASKIIKGSFVSFKAGSSRSVNSSLAMLACIYVVSVGVAL